MSPSPAPTGRANRPSAGCPNGLLLPTAGEVTVGGFNTKATRASQIARKAGFLFQNPDRQICQNTTREEIAFGMRVQGLPEEEVAARTEEALKTLRPRRRPLPFHPQPGGTAADCAGQRPRRKPELVILDEPTTGLDYKECTAIMEHIAKLNREEGLTILMVCHDMELIQSYAERVLVLNGGTLLGDGPTRSIMKDRELLAAARLRPAQIPDLALRLGEGFEDVFTVGEMAEKLRRIARKEETI